MRTKRKAKILELMPTGFCGSNKDIAEHLRLLADEVEREQPIRTVLCFIEMGNGELRKENYGGVCDHARAMGLMAIGLVREL